MWQAFASKDGDEELSQKTAYVAVKAEKFGGWAVVFPLTEKEYEWLRGQKSNEGLVISSSRHPATQKAWCGQCKKTWQHTQE